MKDISAFIDRTVFKKGNILFFFFLIFCFFSRLNLQFFLVDILSQLAFQILIGGILLFFILLFLKRFWTSAICFLVCVVFAADILSSCNHCNAILVDKSQIQNKLRLMSFNISYENPVENFENIREMILSEKPDIVQLQEFSPQMQDKIKTLRSIFPYSTELNKPKGLFDSLILSKHPLTNTKVDDNHVVITNLILNEAEISIVGIHFLPGGTKETFNNVLQQISYLKTIVNNTNKNLILLGDLNMTPTSKRFAKFLKETNLYTYTSYKNITSTWPAFMPNLLGIQIDHILFSNNFKMVNKKTSNSFGSDHRPLIVELSYL
jgi:endonuclease/exonuclease/phosphatase (EEP) superfamily protein YafD